MNSFTYLKKLSDDDLTQTLAAAVQSETKASLFVLHVLAEFEARRLYSKNATSLHHYCTKVLKFSGGAAQRRIDSMRAMRLIPEVEEKLSTGELNLTSVSQAQSLFRHEAKVGKSYTLEQKRVVLQKLENKSTRECEKEIAIISPSAIPQERRRILTANDQGACKTELKVVLDQNLVDKLDKIKALLSHKNPHMTDRGLLEAMADLTLSRIDPARTTPARKSNVAVQRPAPIGASRYISKPVKREVWIRDGGKCTYPGCSSSHFLEYDHLVPYSLGGQSTTENLRLLCRAHNQRVAIERFGFQKMKSYFEKRAGFHDG